MGWVARRSWLERAALAVALATVVAVLVVVFGIGDDSRRETVDRLEKACAPVSGVLGRRSPSEITRRDVLRLTQAAGGAADGLGGLIKDTTGDTRRALQAIRADYGAAAGSVFQLPLVGQTAALLRVQRRASTLGARCPSPLTIEQAGAVQRRLSRPRR